ncbi:MAG: ABC transporter substrate-binding protein [Deltaproteobacteria bacterium]|nr:ABC transporter substrate-binding protein [Deltaproteobacteria bacterium]
MKIKSSVKRHGVSFLILAVAVTCLVGFSTQVYAEEPKRGGILKIISGRSPRVIGWPSSIAGPEIIDFYACMEPLTNISKNGEPAPYLATSWEYGPDYKSLTFKLRKGVKFHDGSDFNAAVAKANILERKSGVLGSEIKIIESVDIIDDYTIRLNLSEFKNVLLWTFAGFNGMMVSPKVIEKAKTKKGKKWAKKNPVGTGPFKFVEYQRDVILKYEKFDGYWQKGKPYLDGIETHYIKDKTTAVTSLRAKEGHVLWETPEKEAAMLIKEGFKYASYPGGIRALAGDTANPESIFANQKVREAIEYAINRQAITQALGHGFWNPVNQYSPNECNGYNPDLKGRLYNPEKARQLLKEAGYPNGLKTKFLVGTSAAARDTMAALQQDLLKVGIDIDIDFMDGGNYFKTMLKGWKNAIVVFGQATPINLTQELNSLYKDGAARLPVITRPAELQELLSKAEVVPDFNEQKGLIKKAVRLMSDKSVVIPLWTFSNIHVMYPSVRGTNFGGALNHWTPADAWLSE